MLLASSFLFPLRLQKLQLLPGNDVPMHRKIFRNAVGEIIHARFYIVFVWFTNGAKIIFIAVAGQDYLKSLAILSVFADAAIMNTMTETITPYINVL